MNRTLAILALVGLTAAACDQTQAPNTPGGRAMNSMPGGTSNPNTALPTTVSNASAAEAAAKAELQARGYSGVRNLSRDQYGNWSAKAMRNNVEVAVLLEPNGRVRELR